MLHNVYVVYDKVAEEAGPPFVAVNDGVARRKYAEIMRDCPDSLRGDYELQMIGYYDSKEPSITPELQYVIPVTISTPTEHATGLEVKDVKA